MICKRQVMRNFFIMTLNIRYGKFRSMSYRLPVYCGGCQDAEKIRRTKSLRCECISSLKLYHRRQGMIQSRSCKQYTYILNAYNPFLCKRSQCFKRSFLGLVQSLRDVDSDDIRFSLPLRVRTSDIDSNLLCWNFLHQLGQVVCYRFPC